MLDLTGKTIVITGAAKRIGRQLALASAEAGASVVIHHGHSDQVAQELVDQIVEAGGKADIIRTDFSDPESSIETFRHLFASTENLYALVNNASIFKPVKFRDTTLEEWRGHMDVNLTMPFLLSQAFAQVLGNKSGRIINILDWRALRPGRDHFPYTISKAALASMTRALAIILAPNIQVNGLALGAILPPSDGGDGDAIIKDVPAGRWAQKRELLDTYLFLLAGPDYITGEILHLDGGRHLV